MTAQRSKRRSFLLKLRTELLEGEVAGREKAIKSFIDVGRHRLFLVEREYGSAMKRAEVKFVRTLIDDIERAVCGSATAPRRREKRFESQERGGEAG